MTEQQRLPTGEEYQDMVNDQPAEVTTEDCYLYLGEHKKKRMWALMEQRGQRVGQAWFNVLSVDDQDRLKDSLADPFYKNDWPSVIESLRYLLESDDPTAKRRMERKK